MKIFFANCIESGYDLLDYMLKKGIKVDCIVTLNKEQAVRYKVSGYKSFEPLAKKYNIPIYYPERYDLKAKKDINFFKKGSPDLLLVFGWQRLIPKEILDTLKIGGLGAHGSSQHLPKGRGRSVINWSLIEGKKKFYLHLFFLDPNKDSGDIIGWEEFDINDFDTCQTLYHKVTICLKRMVVKYIPLILEGKINSQKQDHSKATYYPKRTPEDGLIDWNKKTKEIYNLIRAVTRPYPGAFSFIDGKKFIFWNAQPFDTKLTYDKKQNGEIVEIFADDTFLVKTCDSTLLVTEYQIMNVSNDIYKEFDYNQKIDKEALKLLKVGKVFTNKE